MRGQARPAVLLERFELDRWAEAVPVPASRGVAGTDCVENGVALEPAT